MSDFSTAAGNAAGKAAVNEAGKKFNCKDINFKAPRTWAWILGIFASIALIISGFGAIFTSCIGSGIFALIFGGILVCLEFFCCFKCCKSTKECATKGEKVAGSPFLKGGCYIVTGVVGCVLNAVT